MFPTFCATRCRETNAESIQELFPTLPTYQNPINMNPRPLLCKVSFEVTKMGSGRLQVDHKMRCVLEYVFGVIFVGQGKGCSQESISGIVVVSIRTVFRSLQNH